MRNIKMDLGLGNLITGLEYTACSSSSIHLLSNINHRMTPLWPLVAIVGYRETDFGGGSDGDM